MYRNTIVTLCRLSKTNYYQNFFAVQKNNLKKLWSGIKSLIGNKSINSGLPNTFKINNIYTSDPKNIADAFNKFYGTIAENTKLKIPKTHKKFSDYLDSPCDKSIFFSPTDEKEIFKLIMELDDKKACGPGSIHARIIKLIAPTISIHLTTLFNTVHHSGIFPTPLKEALIFPFYKKGEENLIFNYRPISLVKYWQTVRENHLQSFEIFPLQKQFPFQKSIRI